MSEQQIKRALDNRVEGKVPDLEAKDVGEDSAEDAETTIDEEEESNS